MTNAFWFIFAFVVPTVTSVLAYENTDSEWVAAFMWLVSVLFVFGCAILFYANGWLT